jgi:peroxiredoxin
MAALTVGDSAPDFTLQTMNGSRFSLQEALRKGPVVLAFFKISCPVCHFAFPYLEKLDTSYRSNTVTLVGVSQDSKKDTERFVREYGITFPVLLDDPQNYPVSNAYGLTNVPSIFWVEPGGEIQVSSVGWDRKEIERISSLMSELSSIPPAQIFAPGEKIPDYRPG